MSADVSFLRSLADEIDGSELTHSWRRDRDWLREIATKLAAAEAALAACEKDAERYRWIRDTFHAAKGGASLEVNQVFAYYETPTPGEEVAIQWYPDTPIGFYKIEAATLDEAIDKALADCAPRP